MPKITVQPLRAVDTRDRVIKDEHGIHVTDPRHPLLKGQDFKYEVRWVVHRGKEGDQRPKRRFKRNELNQAQNLHRRLTTASVEGSSFVDEKGMPSDVSPPLTRSASTIEILREYAESQQTVRKSARHRAAVMTFVVFLVHVLRHVDGEIRYRPGRVETVLNESHQHPDIPRAPGELLPLSTLNHSTMEALLQARRTTDVREMAAYERALQKHSVYENRIRTRTAGRPPAYVAVPTIPTGTMVSTRTEQAFDNEMRRLMGWLVRKGYLHENLWETAGLDLRKHHDKVVSKHLVPTQEQAWDIAECIGSMRGGARYRVPIIVAFELAPRPEELFAIEADWFELEESDPALELRWRESIVSGKYSNDGSSVEVGPLKGQKEGAVRRIPISTHLVPLIANHLERFEGSTRFVSAHNGGRIPDRQKFLDQYFHPAVERVMGGETAPELRELQFRRMRHGGITWWLNSGIGVKQAAERSGHRPETLLRYYASASKADNDAFRNALPVPVQLRPALQIVN